MDELLNGALQLLIPVAVTALVALLSYATAFLKEKASGIKQEGARNAVYAALDEASRVAKDAILATQQTFVADIKAKATDGKLTKEEAQEAIETAKNYFVNALSSNSLEILEAMMGPIQSWLTQYLEAKIGEMKLYNPNL